MSYISRTNSYRGYGCSLAETRTQRTQLRQTLSSSFYCMLKFLSTDCIVYTSEIETFEATEPKLYGFVLAHF
jgi:hypothetical protein